MKEKEMGKEVILKTKQKQPERKKRFEFVQKAWNWKLLPLQFVLVALPLITKVYFFESSGYTIYAWHSAEDAYVDIFLQGKLVAFTAVALVTLILAVINLVKQEKEARKQCLLRFIPLFVYGLFVILSTICSENLTYSIFGSMDAKEPVFVLLGYIVIIFYAFLVLNDFADVMQLVTAAVIGSSIMVVIGVLQTTGNDPLLIEAVQRIFAGNRFVDSNGLLQLSFPVGQAYGTLFNPNYVGTYVAMYVPLLLIGFVMYKQIWKKLVCGLSFVGLLVMLFASQSRTGLIAVIAVAVMLLIFLFREIFKHWYVVIPGVTFFVMAFLLLDTYRDNLLTNRLKEMFALESSDDPVSGVDTTGSGVHVLYKDTEFTVRMPISGNDFSYIVTEQGEQLPVSYEEDRSYGYVTLSTGDEIAIRTVNFADFDYCLGFGLDINGRDFYFTNQVVAGNYKYINIVDRLDECVIPANVLPGFEGVASGRGYVWGRTIPLLWKNFIVGSGPDTFGIELPQNDYVARYKSGFDNVIFTRPHNFYLQMGIQTGTLSLIAFLVFYGMYFAGCCKRYFVKKFTKMEQWFGLAVFLSTVGFMASGFANDSLIVVTPVFYVLLGLGMVINTKLCPVEKKKVEKTSEERVVEEKRQ